MIITMILLFGHSLTLSNTRREDKKSPTLTIYISSINRFSEKKFSKEDINREKERKEMTDRIIFTAIPSRPDVARVCADECRIKLTDLSTATLRTDQITVRTMYKMLSKNAQRDTGRISFDTFHALMDDVFRNNARSSGGGKTYQFRRVVQKLYRAADSDSKMSLTPVELMCGLSLLCRPEAGISGVDIDSTTPIVEDCLRIMCPDGNVTYERLNAYFTILFSIFISMSPDLSKICT